MEANVFHESCLVPQGNNQNLGIHSKIWAPNVLLSQIIFENYNKVISETAYFTAMWTSFTSNTLAYRWEFRFSTLETKLSD